MILENSVHSQSIDWLFHTLSYFTAGSWLLSGGKPPLAAFILDDTVPGRVVFDDFKAQNFGEAFRAPSVEELAEHVAAALRAFHQYWNSGGCLDWDSLWQHRVQLPSFSRQIKVP
jgi:hypothetical protein